MRRTIGWILVLGPAGFIAYALVDTAVKANNGYYVPGEAGTALIIIAMMTVVALVPIGVGTLLLLGERRERTGTSLTRRTGRGRERLGWALMIPGLVAVAVTIVGRTGDAAFGGVGAIGALGVVLLGVGAWTVARERRRPDAPTAPDAPPAPGPDATRSPTPSDDHELQDL